MRAYWRKHVTFLIVLSLIFGSAVWTGGMNAHAAARKSIRSLRVMQAGKNIAKKTLKMKVGEAKTLRVKAKPSLSKRDIKFSSTRKKVVSVDKKGKITAKKSGSARIKITVSKKGYKKKTTWIGITVTKNNNDSASSTSASPSTSPAVTQEPSETIAPTTPPNNSTNEPVPTITPSETSEPDETGEPPLTPQPTNTPGDSDADSGKILVAYFSWSGTSERIAQNIISQTGADAFRIERETPYSDDYQTVAYGEAQMEAETNARPPLKDPLVSIAQYDKIVLCYPIWWHTAPMTVGTFLESYDFTGKMIYPVSQSASMDTGQYEQSVEFIRNCAKGATVDAGLFSKDNNAIRNYVENTILKQ